MHKHPKVLALVVFAISVATALIGAKIGHPIKAGNDYGFFNGV